MNMNVLIGMTNVLFFRDVRWLTERCPEGRDVSRTLSGAFLELIDEDEPVTLARIHHEDIGLGNGETRLVVLALFRPLIGGPPYLNEFVCHSEDLLRVIKQILDEPISSEDAAWRHEQRERRAEERALRGPTLSPWTADELEWQRLLS